MFRCLLWAIAAAVRPKALLIADNLCLRQQLLVLHRRKPRPRLEDADRRFWVLACRWFVGWRTSVLIVKPETVLRWHRHGWRRYWRRRSSRKGKPGRRPIAPELRSLIRRMTFENPLWAQRRIQAELARLGFKVSARTVAKYMHRGHPRGPSSRWWSFLRQSVSCLGVRFLLRPNHDVSNTIRVLRDPSRQPASSPRACDGASDCRVDGTADCRMLRLGLPAATLSRSRPRQLLYRQLRSASA
jgi:hypothetical protein